VLRYLSDDSQDSDFEFNVINIRFYITKGYQFRINLSGAVVLEQQRKRLRRSEHQTYLASLHFQYSIHITSTLVNTRSPGKSRGQASQE